MNIEEEKNKLTHILSEQYAQNSLSVDEYERILEYITKIETIKEVAVIERIIREYAVLTDEAITPQTPEKHLSIFSWRSSNLKPARGGGGTYISIFGTNRIIVDNLPKGKTTLNVKSIFGLIEIIVSKHIKIVNETVPICSGIFAPDEVNMEHEDLPELHILGKAIFGNITIKRG
ncbi:MAG: hypothetical protein LBG73_05635 [Spirochaetaceae bacterium]|nr:hypothetical protein [Spirochaetaceae bacterium]